MLLETVLQAGIISIWVIALGLMFYHIFQTVSEKEIHE